MKRQFVEFIIIMFCTINNNAQINTENEPLKWNIGLTMGHSFNGPSEIDFTSDSWWPVTAITTFHNNIPWNLEVKRSLIKNITTGFSINKKGFEGTFFTQKQKFTSTGFSPLLLYNLKDFFLIGGGPSVYLVRHLDYNPKSKLVYKMSKIGFELTTSLRFPQKSRFFTQINVSYCSVGKIKKFEFCDVTAGPNDDVLFYNATNISMSYIYFGAGIGFRI